MPGKTTPAQAALLKKLLRDGPMPIKDVHSWTLEGLMRRGLATVIDGKAVAK